ncbi:MAG: HAMP domain-containing histidine kinase [Leptolyngbyaceae cyanobacterium CSU_1_3]|nr:HAMP domain-containing histidine kinase [Leptolyngbyaceae cyanobacterium CSU_1_3]
MHEWILPTLSEILTRSDQPQDASDSCFWDGAHSPKDKLSAAQQRLRAEREWFGAIAALETLLEQAPPKNSDFSLRGLLLSGPLPVLSKPELLTNFATWSFTADPFATLIGIPFQLPPALDESASRETNPTLSLLPGDPISAEQFCLVLTAEFSLAMVLGENATGEPMFSFSFDPAIVERVWQTLKLRVVLTNAHQMSRLDRLFDQFPPIAPDYKQVTQFSHLLLKHLPTEDTKESPLHAEQIEIALRRTHRRTVHAAHSPASHPTHTSHTQSADVELLQAIAHEVRTPLTTIRMLTRLLLKRRDLPPDVIKRLEMIDRECNEQIDRFGLIFRAVELETSATKLESTSLTPTSLAQVLGQSIPRWQKQASQRNLTLEVILPQQMPPVVSDPTMLDQALTSLIDRSARSLPSGGHIQVEVTVAGDQLKLQLQSQMNGCDRHNPLAHYKPLLKSLGKVLMFQPETGSLSLNLTVTKNLFHALGGKLIVRQRPEQGEVLTLFLPLEPGSFDSGPLHQI